MENPQTDPLDSLLTAAGPLLRSDHESIHPKLSSLLASLRQAGGGEYWHKDGTFIEHLVGIFRILHQWGASSDVCLAGLFHSAYATSYLGQPLFCSRDQVRGLIGEAAERIVHLFHIAPRQELVHSILVGSYSDEELVEHLTASSQVFDWSKTEELWRGKVNSILPEGGIELKGVKLTRRMVAVLVVMMMADYADEMFGFQDEMYENLNGRMEFSGGNFVALWPGEGKPGLWLNMVSRLGAVYNLIRREEAVFVKERIEAGGVSVDRDRDEDIELVLPPVFENCSRLVGAEEQNSARDMYWQSVCENLSGK